MNHGSCFGWEIPFDIMRRTPIPPLTLWMESKNSWLLRHHATWNPPHLVAAAPALLGDPINDWYYCGCIRAASRHPPPCWIRYDDSSIYIPVLVYYAHPTIDLIIASPH